MRRFLALIALLPWFGACAHEAGPGTSSTTAPLLGTYWKLAKLGDQVITSPPGVREMHLVMNADNLRVTGFSGCNQLMGGYVLDGASLRFDQVAGTRMACVSGMDFEGKFLAMFGQVARWKIEGETLTFLDADGHPLAVFDGRTRPAS